MYNIFNNGTRMLVATNIIASLVIVIARPCAIHIMAWVWICGNVGESRRELHALWLPNTS